MNGLQFFLTRYDRTTSMVREMFAGLSDEQIRTPPYPGVNTLAWLAWHIPRVEDVGVNRLVLDDEQLFVRDGWARRLNVPRRDFGTGMTPSEVSDLSRNVDLEQLLVYSDAVIARTLEVVRSLSPDELDRVNDASYVQRVVDKDYFVTEDASWVPAYMNGQTRGFSLSTWPSHTSLSITARPTLFVV